VKRVFKSVAELDNKAYEKYLLSEDILMEHAALGLKRAVKKAKKAKSILIVSGPGNNGADGITLARLLQGEKYKIFVYLPFGAKSVMAKLQKSRAEALGVSFVNKIKKADIILDALFGSGLNKELNEQTKELISKLNNLKAFKIACDIPSGINLRGDFDVAFRADITVSMGALKEAYFYEKAIDVCGKVINIDLGLSYEKYCNKTDTFVLEKNDLKLPLRKHKSTHKGNFGHVGVLEGEMRGAPTISALSALNFGAGLVSIIGYENHNYPVSLMHKTHMPKDAVLALGMGLGNGYLADDIFHFAQEAKALVLDADIFKNSVVIKLLELDKPKILTPHPKEFASLLQITSTKKITTQEIVKNKFEIAKEFSKKYKNIVLVLKGANTIIAQDGIVYINPFSEPALSKGGSGDVLAGMIAALLAQNYTPLNSAISAVLAHTIAAKKYKNTNYSLTPKKLIKLLSKLK